jgi:RNA methyltransferase, TrmH family
MFSKLHTKYIQSLHHKKFRDEFGVFIAEGPKPVSDLLASPQLICKALFALPGWIRANEPLIASKNVDEIFELRDFELEKISALATANQVLAVFEKLAADEIPVIFNKITLVLDTLQDPGNLGTIIRIADWFGIENIICSHGCADRYNPKVVQSTMGSLARVNMVYADLPEWLQKNKSVSSYAATLNGKNIKQMGPLTAAIIIIGNESRGISDEILQGVNEKISIIRTGKAESLNAAVATGIILSHII